MRASQSRALRRFPRSYLAIASALTACAVGSLLVYYALVIVGLESWGDVIAWNVIPSFFAQARRMGDTIGLSPAVVTVLPVPAYAALYALCWRYLKRFDCGLMVAQRASFPLLAALLLGGTGILALECYGFATDPSMRVREPVSLTLFPSDKGLNLEGVSLDPARAARIDRLQSTARSEYVPAAGKHRNVIVIVVDALRPDHMGIYGYARDTTPKLAAVVAHQPTEIVRGVHSSCGDTICGLMSLFSSEFPPDFSFRPLTLHEVLRRNGYRVHLILSGDHTYFYSLKGLYGRVDSFYDGTHAQGYFVNDDRLVIDHLASMCADERKRDQFLRQWGTGCGFDDRCAAPSARKEGIPA